MFSGWTINSDLHMLWCRSMLNWYLIVLILVSSTWCIGVCSIDSELPVVLDIEWKKCGYWFVTGFHNFITLMLLKFSMSAKYMTIKLSSFLKRIPVTCRILVFARRGGRIVTPLLIPSRVPDTVFVIWPLRVVCWCKLHHLIKKFAFVHTNSK